MVLGVSRKPRPERPTSAEEATHVRGRRHVKANKTGTSSSSSPAGKYSMI